MTERPLDDATIQAYLESLSEVEVVALFEAVRLRIKRGWDYRLVVSLAVVWVAAWIWVGGVGPLPGIVTGIVAVLIAAGFLWPLVRWLHNRALKGEVASRINANGV